MVESVGPAKFYGNSLPRPRIYTDVKFNEERVDPPISVTDPLISWAEEAHWFMGGLSFQRHRLQGRIEGNIDKLRSERERSFKKKAKIVICSENDVGSLSPPPDPMAVKRKRRMVNEDEEDVEYKRRIVRKLKDEFDLVATVSEPERAVGRGIGKRLVKGLKAVAADARTSPRLIKNHLT